MIRRVGAIAVKVAHFPPVSAVLGRVRARLSQRRHASAVARYSDINAFDHKVLSQNGEDGIIAELMRRVGRDRYFVEFGVQDGSESNTALLSLHYKWSGLLIEGNPAFAAALARRFEGTGVRVQSSFVTRENIVELFESAQVPREFDLLSIDIDGNDYWVWEALAAYRPRVTIMEFNGSLGASTFWIMRYRADHIWKTDCYYGASLTAMTHLGKQLGYALVGTDRSGTNAFFVRADLLEACGFPELTPERAYHKPSLLSALFGIAEGPAVHDPAQLSDPQITGR